MANKIITEDIVTNVINNYLKENCMLKEYKNPKDAETLRVCGDMLKTMYENIIANGTSAHEITTEKLSNIIHEIEKLEKMMSL